jgi:Leucine-rich repeat (LRR) protein
MRKKIKALKLLTACALILITKPILAEQTDSKDTPPVQGRIVNFPPDRSMGYLWIQDEGTVNVNSTFGISPGAPEEETWQFIGHAQGDIVVPPGKRLSLSIPNDKNVWKDLSPLKNLKPNDLYQLWLPGDIGGKTSPIDTCMPHIAHLTGIKDLHLKWSHVSTKGLQFIKDFHSLEYLYLPKRIDDTTMIFISQLKSLKGLYFSGTGQVTDEGLAALQHLPNLEEITFEGEGKITSASLRHLSKIPSLKKLSFFCNTVSDKDFIYLRDMPQLKTLMLQHTNITDSGLQFLSNLQKLEDLDLYDTDVTDAGIPHLVKLKSLRRLEFKKHWQSKKEPITEKAAPFLAQIPTLEYLEFESLAVTDYALSELSKLPNLKTLCAIYGRSGESVTNIGLQHLSKIKSLESLSINTEKVTDEGILSLTKLTNLKELILTSCPKITNQGLSLIADMKNLKKISLTVSRYGRPEETCVTISGLASLNALTNLKSLSLTGVIQDSTGLNLSNLKNLESLTITCKVTSMQKRGVSLFPIHQSFTDNDLACLENLKNLQILCLSESDGITDKGLMHLQGLTNLDTLYIGGPGLTDEGLSYLKKMKKLNDLEISGNFTEYGLQHLKELKALQILYLSLEYGIPNRAVKELKNSLPFLSDFNIYIK